MRVVFLALFAFAAAPKVQAQPIRRIHTTFVLTRESGQWLVRYQHIMDERERVDLQGEVRSLR